MQPKTVSRGPDEAISAEQSAFEESRELANKVLDLVDQHLMPPMPNTYEVLYTYASGTNETVNKQIDRIIETSGGIDRYDISQIYENHFVSTEEQRRQNDKTNEILKREIDSIIELVNAHGFSNKEYAGTLDATLKNLSFGINPQELKEIVKTLLTDNRRMQAESLELSDMLEQSKQQMQKMGEELAEARRTALIDSVTGIGNRSWLTYRLESDFSEPMDPTKDYSLIFVDIDHFKRINDEFGHAAGDMVLRYFGSLLSNHVTDSDLCARYGGEEFVILLPDTGKDEAYEFAENMRKKLERSKLIFALSKQPLGQVTASFGIAMRRESDTPESILSRADELLYKAKNDGRNTTRLEC